MPKSMLCGSSCPLQAGPAFSCARWHRLFVEAYVGHPAILRWRFARQRLNLFTAGVGALLMLMLFGNDLGLIAFVGTILIGIVKKNAIMMVDFALVAEKREGREPRAAIHQACLLRFRPIMMTAMCALIAGRLLALGQDAGAELRRPLGVAIVGGLLVSQALTL